MKNKEIEMRYSQMKSSWNHIVNANIELVDDNKMLKEENERLNNIINELEKYLKGYSNDLEFRCYANMFLDKLQELKGEGKECEQ